MNSTMFPTGNKRNEVIYQSANLYNSDKLSKDSLPLSDNLNHQNALSCNQSEESY